MIYIGNDISKDTFSIALPQDEMYKKFQLHTFSNDKAGYQAAPAGYGPARRRSLSTEVR